MRSRAVLLAALALAACARAPEAPAAPVEAAASLADKGFYGKITPRAATAIHAPPNVFRMKGWNSRNTWIKLVDIAPDGTRIEAGKEIARFEFSHEDALPWIKKRVAETQAELESARSQVTEEQRKLGSSAEVKGLAREKAELDTGKAGLVSDRELELLKLGSLRAAAEEAAAVTLANASTARQSSELAFLAARADEWKSGIDRYQMFERRTHVAAPHAGWVRYGYLNHVRRKVQKPDDMPSGTPFVYVAEDERLSVDFYVPEHRVAALAIGAKVAVRLPDEERRVEAVVRALAPFPQEIGFLRGDDELPDAREKAYVVTADFDPTPPFFSSGIEVRVEP